MYYTFKFIVDSFSNLGQMLSPNWIIITNLILSVIFFALYKELEEEHPRASEIFMFLGGATFFGLILGACSGAEAHFASLEN